MTNLLKFASEVRRYGMDFAPKAELAGGDTLSTVTSVAAAPSGLTLGSPSISGSRVVFSVSGGTAETTYRVTAVAVTAGGWTLEGVGTLSVYA